MHIQTSTDWVTAERELLAKIQLLPNASQDLSKICKNIGVLISDLSREEINCRRLQKQTIKHAELIKQINEQLDFLDKMVTFAALFQTP